MNQEQSFDHFIDPMTPVSTKLFFNWHIYSKDSGGTLQELAFFEQSGQRQYLADRVMPQQTLHEAITNGLHKDFGISDWEFIRPVNFSDNTQDNQGLTVQRVNVHVEIPYFKVIDQRVNGLHLQWFVSDLKDEATADSAKQVIDGQLVEALRQGEKKDIKELWGAFTNWLQAATPTQYEKLNPAATFNEIEDFARTTGYELPDSLAQLYKLNNGGLCGTEGMNSILSLEFLSLKEVIEAWKGWREVEQGMYLDGEEPTYPNDAIKNTYANPKWIPILNDGGGNNIGIDLDPGKTGTYGQVINFGRDEQSKFVIADSLESFLSLILLCIADGKVGITQDTDAHWFLNTDTHLTDELRKMIVPEGFVSSASGQSKPQSEVLGFFYYDEYSEGRITGSSSVKVERLGSEVAVETGNKELKDVFKGVIGQIDPQLDPTVYKQELLKQLPAGINTMHLRHED